MVSAGDGPTSRATESRRFRRRLLIAAASGVLGLAIVLALFAHFAQRLESDISRRADDDAARRARSIYAAEPNEYLLSVSSCAAVRGPSGTSGTTPSNRVRVTGTVANRSASTRQFLVKLTVSDPTHEDIGSAATVTPPIARGNTTVISVETAVSGLSGQPACALSVPTVESQKTG